MDSFNSAYTTPPSIRSSEQYYKPQLKTEFEGNYIQVRARSARGRHVFRLVWNALRETEFNSIRQFFDNHIGSAFYWTHPLTNVTHTVVFGEDKLNSDFVGAGLRQVTIVLEEI